MWLGVLVITVMAAWVEYTRALILAVLIAVAIGLLARELQSPNITRLARRMVGIFAVGAVLVSAALVVLPVDSQYFAQRLQELSKPLNGGRVANWSTRVNRLPLVEKSVARSDLLFGVGYPTPAPQMATLVDRWSADMAWIGILYRFGVVGVALFGLMFAGFGARAYRLFRSKRGEASYLALAYLITVALTFFMSFREWTFMVPLVFPMGLWLFAFMSAEAMRPDSLDDSTGSPALSTTEPFATSAPVP